MICERTCASGIEMGMLVPGTFLTVSVRNASSVDSSQTSPALDIAPLYLNPGTCPAGRPTTPANEGPKPFTPGLTVWHDAHCDSNAFWPCATLSCATANDPKLRSAPTNPIRAVMFMSGSSVKQWFG